MNVVPIDPHKQPLAYCAHCNKKLTTAPMEHLGRWVICPADPLHYAAVVRGPTGKQWLRFEKWMRDYELKWSPINKLGLKDRAGYYLLGRLLLLFGLLLAAGYSSLYAPFIFSFCVLSILTALFLFDILIPNTSVAFCTQTPTRPFRTVVLTLFAFVQIGVAFAIVHSAWDPSLTFVGAIYRSIAITTTLEVPEQLKGANPQDLFQFLVMFQLVVSLYFLSIILAIIVSWSSGSPARQQPITIKELNS